MSILLQSCHNPTVLSFIPQDVRRARGCSGERTERQTTCRLELDLIFFLSLFYSFILSLSVFSVPLFVLCLSSFSLSFFLSACLSLISPSVLSVTLSVLSLCPSVPSLSPSVLSVTPSVLSVSPSFLFVSPSLLPLSAQGLEKEKVIDQDSGPAGHAERLEQTER